MPKTVTESEHIDGFIKIFIDQEQEPDYFPLNKWDYEKMEWKEKPYPTFTEKWRKRLGFD